MIDMDVQLVGWPTEQEKEWVYECALGTEGKCTDKIPTDRWLHKILEARHSPIRELWFLFELRDIPYWVSVHLVRHHVGVNCYVQSQRNDRQDNYDRNAARQDAPITMRMSINAEALMNLANKRLCQKASHETRQVVQMMCLQVLDTCPYFEGLLVPACEYYGGKCHEMKPCGRWDAKNEQQSE